MAIASTDILYKPSITTGSQGDSTSQSNVNLALGKYMASNQITDATLANLFDAISGAENAAATVDYRCFFVHNAHATLTWQTVIVYISAQTTGGADITIGLDPAGVVTHNSVTAQAATIANETTAPTGVTFSSPTTGAPLAVGNVAAGSCFAIWVKRTATNSAALANDGGVVRAEGSTAA